VDQRRVERASAHLVIGDHLMLRGQGIGSRRPHPARPAAPPQAQRLKWREC
jgi:hypothetical protein